MAKKRRRRKKLTKAEAGRLGGKATVRKYGPEHMRRLGKAGFAGLRKKFGFNLTDPANGAGLGAIRWLQRRGKFPRQSAEQTAAEQQWYEETMEQFLGAIEEDPKS